MSTQGGRRFLKGPDCAIRWLTVMMMWVVFLACRPAFKSGFLVGVDVVKDRLPPRTKAVVACLARGLMGVFSIITIVQSFKPMQSQWDMNLVNSKIAPKHIIYF